jgi:protein TonB
MKTIKTKQSGIERSRPVFLQIGLIMALAACLTAFEWKTYEKANVILSGSIPFFIPDEIIALAAPPKPPPPPVSVTQFNLNPDPEIDLPDITVEAGIDLTIPEIPYVPPALPDELPEVDDIPHIFPEVMPHFPGGEEALFRFLRNNVRYPAAAREAGISGTVFLAFVVERDGSITDVEVLRGVGGGCSEEAVRVVKMMPVWNPGIQSGRYVRVKFTMPVKFILQ